MQQLPPSQNEVRAFDDLLGALTDIEEGVTTTPKSVPVHNEYERPLVEGEKRSKIVPYVDTRAEDEARAAGEMHGLLESLSEIVPDYDQFKHKPEPQVDYSQMAQQFNNNQFNTMYDDESYDPYEEQRRLDELSRKMAAGTLDETVYVEPTKNNPSQPSQPIIQPGKTWKMVEESVNGLKNAKKYKIINAYDNSVLMDNIMMYESAYALHAVLNKGQAITNPKILGIISMGLQYTSAVTEMIKYAKERNKVLNESNYSRAQEIDKILAEKKDYANSLKKDVLAFLRSEGFIK